MRALQEFIVKRKADKVKASTLNGALAITRHILKLAGEEWDGRAKPLMERVPKIKLLLIRDVRAAYPLSREEQAMFFPELLDHLVKMALFKVNTGCREEEVNGLKWKYEVKVPELETSVFIIPGQKGKNAQDRLAVLNRVAKSVIEWQRGVHPEYGFVFTPRSRKRKRHEALAEPTKPKPLARLNGNAWRDARERAADRWQKEKGESAPIGLRRVRVHDLKHTFGRRLRADGVSFEDRQDLLGHKKWADHHPLLSCRAGQRDRGCGKCLRSRVPHFPAVTLLRRKSG